VRQVVVAATLERLHALDRVGLDAAEHDHRHLAVPAPSGLALAQAAAELGGGGIGKLVSDQDEIGRGLLGQAQRLVAGTGPDDGEAGHESWRSSSPRTCGSGSARRTAALMGRTLTGERAPKQCPFPPALQPICDGLSPAVRSGRGG